MKVNVFIAKGRDNTRPEQKDFISLYSYTIEDKERGQLPIDELERVVWDALDCAIRPLTMATEMYSVPRQFNWSSDTHEVAYKSFDFGLKNKIWVMVDIR